MTDPLHDIDQPIPAKAADRSTATGDTKHERIRAFDDPVMFKVKVQHGVCRYLCGPEDRA
ncbi:hypothetical protein ACQPZG_16735 [Streptomyces sp. CA-294286]|uniref:hypothetical protein n=1 Tax=Streptomyces sp. CA-294286 TaxID=3240070 RepID=UPI003D9011D2